MDWKMIYYGNELMYPFWFFVLGGYITLILLYEFLIYDFWWMLVFIISWIIINRIICWYSKKQIKPFNKE